MNYKGNTPETVGKGASYVYSLNGETGEGGGEGGGTEPDPEATQYVLDGDAIKAAHTEAWSYSSGEKIVTATDHSKWTLFNTYANTSQVTVQMNKGKSAYVLSPVAPEGKEIKKVSVVLNKSADGTGEMGDRPMDILNADGTKTLLDDVTGQTLADGMELPAGTTQVRIICDEANGGAVYITSISIIFAEGGEGGDTPGPDDPDQPKLPVNDGSEANPFTVEDAVYVARNSEEAKEYYVKAVVGKDINIKNGAATFELKDGTTAEVLTVVKAKSFKGADFDGTEPLEWLDEVILKGKVTEYRTLPALTEASFVKWNGKKTFKNAETDLSKVIALADDADTYFSAVVSGVSTNSFVVTDGTSNFYVYKPATVAAIGDLVNVSGVKTTYGGVVETKQGAEVEVVESGKTVTYGTATDITATFDAYPAANTGKTSDYITFTGKLVKSGNYYNVEVEGATTYKGSVSNPVEALGLADLADKTVVFTGYYVGTSGNTTKYINFICTKAEEYKETPAESVQIDLVFNQLPCEGFPTASGTKTGTYKLQGYDFSFSAQTAFYYSSSKYLMIGKKDSYILLPAIEGKKLISINVKTTSGISASVIADVRSADGSVDLNLQTTALGTSADITWNIPDAKQAENTSFRIQVETAHNAQFSEIHLVYE
jgi:hypothetical protein